MPALRSSNHPEYRCVYERHPNGNVVGNLYLEGHGYVRSFEAMPVAGTFVLEEDGKAIRFNM
jgi:hypothetical protein